MPVFALSSLVMGLAHPVSSKVLTRHGSPKFKIGASSMQGFRNEMEDDHTIKTAMTKMTSKSFFGVFDGHNGDTCAHWSAKNLWTYIDNLSEHTETALKQACLQADSDFLTTDPASARGGGRGGGSGCTAVFCVLDTSTEGGYEIKTCNIGDSRALLCRDGRTIALTDDHKPTNEEERNRIVAAGGFVESARVDGQLALSRAMGDSQYKTNESLPAEQQKVIPVPDISYEKLQPNDFLLICCDGIFESFTNEEAVKFVHQKLKETDDLAMITALLMDAVLAAGSKDNMTAMLILPVDGTAYHRDQDEFLPGIYNDHRQNSSFTEAYTRDARLNGFTLEQAIALQEKNAASGYYKPAPIQARGFLFPFFAAAQADKDEDDDDDDDQSNPSPIAPPSGQM